MINCHSCVDLPDNEREAHVVAGATVRTVPRLGVVPGITLSSGPGSIRAMAASGGSVLVLNSGSSSVKFALIAAGTGERVLGGLADEVGTPEAVLRIQRPGGDACEPLPDGSRQVSLRANGYMGMGAPAGPYHHYTFELYALDTKLDVPQGASAQAADTRKAVMNAMEGHILGKAILVARFHQ